ncbi:hypothetical protein [Methylobacterium sp. NEAU K]|uniref:hypothetical protein n=1 Tax=Methylobacterium sp. NEAU K TaxID=3064946 RepID=UPI00273648C1|nr:hypothetical protein [Methylobacterium sp. NEAU K]MDP4004917.1 hypothetical protein [Methylobacterium sp. NEAU K]
MASRKALTLLTLLVAAPASAQGVYPYAPAHGGYAVDFVRGTYIGAPLTRVPRPSEIVPSPWSYGTYGIPTVSGIASAPAAQPTITVINATAPKARGRRGDGATDEGHAAGARVIAVQVPRR